MKLVAFKAILVLLLVISCEAANSRVRNCFKTFAGQVNGDVQAIRNYNAPTTKACVNNVRANLSKLKSQLQQLRRCL
ncbi:hypothetical protein quinque_009897 [Culex quinquefasciatus]|uniref:Putative conserved secreted protein n=1 Tax=Corethrella appendiculata TaxID=1370023 RepID=U5EMW3_9DIPT